MSVWSSNACEKCPLLLENENEQVSSSNTFGILMDSYLVHLLYMPCILEQFTYTYNAMCAYRWVNYVSIVMA